MVKKGEKIEFPRGGTHFYCGADKYIASIANVRFPPHSVPKKKVLVDDIFSL